MHFLAEEVYSGVIEPRAVLLKALVLVCIKCDLRAQRERLFTGYNHTELYGFDIRKKSDGGEGQRGFGLHERDGFHTEHGDLQHCCLSCLAT
ncbi:unnamed protein product [Microthlaspi erraticum]|uniref:Uncharacterized protein n=1 Tax=Microthlaspi erraticum TaxID=1685480 RepID=A0A6D2JJB6_9BRAS|nr:unnamed protein product [Microthlaspi erraticum]